MGKSKGMSGMLSKMKGGTNMKQHMPSGKTMPPGSQAVGLRTAKTAASESSAIAECKKHVC